MRLPAVILCCALGAIGVRATEMIDLPVMQPPVSDTHDGEWVFKLLPKSFQANPEFEMTIMCELTPYGRTLPAATPEHPVYYVGHNSGRQNMGEYYGSESTPKNLEQIITRSLSTNGYLPQPDPKQAPALAVFYHWGSSNAMDKEDKMAYPMQNRLQERERRALIGSSHFGRELRERGSYDLGNLFPLTPEQEYLLDQSKNSLYYIVVSAYDYAALTRKERKLVWRARLTVNAQGVAMSEAMPPLVLTAGTSFGRDTNGCQIVTRRASRGKVELKPLIIVEENVPTAQPASKP